MKNIILLLIVGLTGCINVKEDFDLNCTSECTVIQGFCTTTDNQAIKDLYVEIVYKKGAGLSSSVRRIKKAVTDENGFFKLEFYLQDSEMSGHALQLQAFVSDLQEVETYLTSDIYNTGHWKKYIHIHIRDTIVDGSFYLPKMAMLSINLNDFETVQDGDYFKIKTTFEDYVFNDEAVNLPNQIINIPVADGEINILEVSSKKNGEVTILEPLSIFIPVNENIELNYEY